VLVALLVALAISVLAITGARAIIDTDSADRAHEAEAAAGTVASGVGVDLGRGLRGITQAAAAVPSSGPFALVGDPHSFAPGAIDVGLVLVAGELPSLAGPSPLTPEHRADPELAAVLDRARDSGAPQLTAPVEVAEDSYPLIISAVYTPGAQLGAPVSSSDRRARLAGWVVAVVDIDALVLDHAPDDMVVTVRDSGRPPPEEGSPAGSEQQVVLVGDRALVVEAHDPTDAGVSALTWVIGGAGVVLAASVASLLVSARRRERTARRVAEERAQQVRLIGEVAPLVQQSLELAEVLPSVAVQLSDHFELAGVALSTGSSRGGQIELFSLGVEPDASVKPVLHPPEHLEAGDTLRLALQRGGRSVALLQVVAGRDLDSGELESLRALSELITAAMVNASLYASQQEALKQLRELDGLKTVFLGTASHELRTPATAIAGFAGLLTSSWDRFSEEQRRDFVQRIAANARSLSTVVQDLLDFSLLDRGTLSVSLEALDVGEVVSGVVDRLGPAFGEHEVESNIQPTPAVAADRSGLERITTNLLTNAVKFSPRGTTIGVAVRSSGRDVFLEVSDQGPGVPAEERERVFTRFYRGTGDAVLQTRGVGIGLSVVSEFVARMHGEVSVDDAPGGGARFRVRLPAVTTDTTEEVADATTR
jgi:signal transduction histidine kinase